MDDYLKTDMTEFGLMLKSINPSVEWIAIPPEVKWVDAGCSMNQLSALKYVEVQDVYVLLSIMIHTLSSRCCPPLKHAGKDNKASQMTQFQDSSSRISSSRSVCPFLGQAV